MSFTAGDEHLPDDVGSALGTCVAAMTNLNTLVLHCLSLPVLKALAYREEPLDDFYVLFPGVNWEVSICYTNVQERCTTSSCVFCRLVAYFRLVSTGVGTALHVICGIVLLLR